MTTVQPARSEEEKEKKEEGVYLKDPVKELIGLVVQTLLREEGFQVWSDMVEYHKNLSRRLLERLPELEGRPLDMGRFYACFKAGWQEWKKKGSQQEESSFGMFMDAMNVDLTRSFIQEGDDM